MKDYPSYIKFSAVAVSIALLLVAMVVARDLLVPFCWSILLALVILPFTQWLEKKIKHRGISAIISIIVLIAIIGGVIFLLSSQVINLANEVPQIFKKLSLYLEDFRMFIEERMGIPYQDQPGELLIRLSTFLQESLGTLGKTLTQTVKAILFIGIMPIYIFFLLYYRQRFSQFLIRLYGRNDEGSMIFKVQKASGVVQNYLSGMLIVTVIVAVLVLAVFLAMDIKHALFFAIFVAVLNLIPYIGVLLASTVSILYVLVTKDSLIYPVLTLALLWGIQLLENNLITPFIVGRQIQLNPLAVILVIILGGMIWGVSGMVLFIPMLGGLKVILDETEGLQPYGYLLGDEKKS
ncbi:MAG: AI-2E family transporter [Owenweeksia sp.]|nr:AI-2E family transporter [Owenweeksia sp.]